MKVLLFQKAVVDNSKNFSKAHKSVYSLYRWNVLHEQIALNIAYSNINVEKSVDTGKYHSQPFGRLSQCTSKYASKFCSVQH